MGLFGQSKKDPKELVRQWQAQLRKEGRQLERQILGIQREEEKVKRSLKEAAKKGDRDVCRILAKEVVRSHKAISKIHAAKAQLKSVEYNMNQQLATLRMSGSLQKSAEVMKSMSELIKVSDVAATMREMSKEMMKAGIIEEMLDDVFESVDDQEELEEEAQQEVDKVLWELTAGQLGKAPSVIRDSLPVVEPIAAAVDDDDVEEDVTGMQARLEALRS
jgi:charged multivesicular body protein 3